jgi:hypothetical protein
VDITYPVIEKMSTVSYCQTDTEVLDAGRRPLLDCVTTDTRDLYSVTDWTGRKLNFIKLVNYKQNTVRPVTLKRPVEFGVETCCCTKTYWFRTVSTLH